MKKVVIIGCGFAGLSACRRLSKFRKSVEVTVIDKKETSDFLPLLPDAIGRNIKPEFTSYPIKSLSRRLKFNFINQEATSIDLDKNIVATGSGNLAYDYLIIASGSETNFYGKQQLQNSAYKLNSLKDVLRLRRDIAEKDFKNFVIMGAGYTGIEIATNLRIYLEKKSAPKKIIIVERSASILGPLPEWMKRYTNDNLNRLNIEVACNTTVEKLEGEALWLTNGRMFDKPILIWAAGVKTADFVRDLNAEKNPQGRVKVDQYLRVRDNCFILGDCAYVGFKDNFLRMAVQFAIFQAVCAANNIIRQIEARKLKKYKPFDIGYIIPMANNRSCGEIIGLNSTGMLATIMHFMMCIYRSVGLRNKIGVIRGLIGG